MFESRYRRHMTTQTTPLPGLPRLNLEVIMGPALIGVCLASTFYLLTCQLTYKYFARFGEDAWYYKLSVAVVWMTDTAHLFCSIRTIYHFLVLHYGQFETLLVIPSTLPIMLVLNTVSEIVTHSNIIIKVWSFSDHKKAIPLFSLIIIRTAFATALTVKGFKQPWFARVHSYEWSVIGTLALDITLDVTLCGMLTFVLLTRRTGNESSSTDEIVNRVVQYAVGTGALSCACAITILICLLAIPNTLIYLTPLMLLEKLYVLSYLVLINSRHMLRRLNGKHQDRNMEMSAVKFASKSSPSVGIGRETLTPHRPHGQSNSEISRHSDIEENDV